MSFHGSQQIHQQQNFSRRRTSVCQSGSPLRVAMELRCLREANVTLNPDFPTSIPAFPALGNYEQIVGCIMESLRSGQVSIDDFERGVEAVRIHISSISRRSSFLDSQRSGETSTTPTASHTTPIQRRERAQSYSTKPVPLSFEEDEGLFRGDRKWSVDTASTTLPPSCSNERRLRVLTSVPSSSPNLGCSPAPNLPLPPVSPSTLSLPRARIYSSNVFDAIAPSPAVTPLFTPLTSSTSGSESSNLIPISITDLSIGDPVGSGSFGVVHRARVKSTGQLIVVKVVSVDSHDKRSLEHVEALENELHLLQSLQHPRIVRYLGHERTNLKLGVQVGASGEEGEKLLVMCEYMPGGSVAGAIRQFGPFDEKAIALHTRQIIEGLAFLHENRVCHRDLKCDNVLIDLNGCCKLADFGCSKRLDVSPEGATVIMKSVKGSIPWMAPEVLMGQGYGRPSDVWALGCVVLEMATGQNPWGHFDNIMQAMYRIGMGNKGPEIPDHLSETCRNFVARCLARDPKHRATVVELLDDPFLRPETRQTHFPL
jgi:hypothetical protein